MDHAARGELYNEGGAEEGGQQTPRPCDASGAARAGGSPVAILPRLASGGAAVRWSPSLRLSSAFDSVRTLRSLSRSLGFRSRVRRPVLLPSLVNADSERRCLLGGTGPLGTHSFISFGFHSRWAPL